MSAFLPSSINVASEPFRRERARNAAMAVLCGLLALGLLVQIGLILQSRAQAADLRRTIDSERAELERLGRAQNQ